jgi:hypothetical protein
MWKYQNKEEVFYFLVYKKIHKIDVVLGNY